MPLIPLPHLEELRIGMFVKLECSWWRHPFAKSTFKIATGKDIDIIRGIKNVKVLYDPDLSDPLQTPPLDQDLLDPEEPTEDALDAEDASLPPPPEPAPESPPKGKASEKEERRRLFREHREKFRKVETAYWRILGESKDIFKGVSSGHAIGLKQAGQVVTNLHSVLQDPGSTMTLMDVVSSHGMAKGLSYHAINVCILSMITGRTMHLTSDELKALALAALFHDIGQRFLPMKVKFEGSGISTLADPTTIPLHPDEGRKLLQQFPDFPLKSLEAIHHHHERLDGSGYPQGLTEAAISPLAKILMVIDEYDELCNAPDPRSSLTPHEALSRLFKAHHDVPRGKFSLEVVKALIQSVSVYPPGTIVELNEGSLGIVTSINLRAPTKPLILLYSASMRKHDAVLVDLAEEDSLSIVRSIRPRDLPPEALEHLSPHRMAIFVHTNPAPNPVHLHLNSKVSPRL